MTFIEELFTIVAVISGTMLTRFLPFLFFPAGKQIPGYLQYLGHQLPAAILGMLVIYCLKDLNFTSSNHALPEISSTIIIILIHLKFRHMLFSIATGTIFYILVQNKFIF